MALKLEENSSVVFYSTLQYIEISFRSRSLEIIDFLAPGPLSLSLLSKFKDYNFTINLSIAQLNTKSNNTSLTKQKSF